MLSEKIGFLFRLAGDCTFTLSVRPSVQTAVGSRLRHHGHSGAGRRESEDSCMVTRCPLQGAGLLRTHFPLLLVLETWLIMSLVTSLITPLLVIGKNICGVIFRNSSGGRICRELRHSLSPGNHPVVGRCRLCGTVLRGGAEPDGAGGAARRMQGTEPPRAVFQTCPMLRIIWDHGLSFRIQAPPRTRNRPGGREGPCEKAFRGSPRLSGLGSSAVGEEEDPRLCSRPGESLGIGLGT